jgi:hypothetical protein
MIVLKKGLRTDLEDYFSMWVFSITPAKKQRTPFITITDKRIAAYHKVVDLLTITQAPEEVHVFQVWTGKWKDDCFYYTLDKLIQYISDNNIEVPVV